MRQDWVFRQILPYHLVILLLSCSAEKKYYQCVTDNSGGAGIKAYTVQIEDDRPFARPGLVFLARGIDRDEGYVLVNGHRYLLPPLPGGSAGITSGENRQEGKAGWYSPADNDELLGKMVVPLQREHLRTGNNEVVFEKTPGTNGYLVTDARITPVAESVAKIVQLTYRVVTRGEQPRIDDFDYVVNYRGEGRSKKADLPEWARRGRVRYYRAGINFDYLDRMFQMFQEGHFNQVMLQVATPSDTTTAEYRRYKDFIDRCHASGLRVTFDGGAGGQPIRLNSISADSVAVYPEMEAWLSRDEYGNPRWRRQGQSFWPDLNNRDYRNRVLQTAELAIDAGVDELYYDWAIGGTRGIVCFFWDVQQLIQRKGKNLTVFGNCKGNIIADGICDINYSEGIEEAGIWDGRWVHNVAQAKFYDAVGEGWKPYRSKYEGADPGVPNPGAHSVVDDMKIGWKRPMAEAKAFQSDFAIAEAGRKLLDGWIRQDNPVAIQSWTDICQYNRFFAEQEGLFTEVASVANIGLLAPPVIPSFEASVKRIPLIHALIEMNIMFDVILLDELNHQTLSRYDLIIIPDIPWIEEENLKALRTYKNKGGKILTLGSRSELHQLATDTLSADLCYEQPDEPSRQKLLETLGHLSGDRVITLENGDHILANVVKKVQSDSVIIHLVNYSEKKINLKIRLHFTHTLKSILPQSIVLYSPDNIRNEINDLHFENQAVEFVLPEIDIYNIVILN